MRGEYLGMLLATLWTRALSQCSQGYYQAASGSTVCKACTAGSYSTANYCKMCDSGKFSNTTAATTCRTCAAGTYTGCSLFWLSSASPFTIQRMDLTNTSSFSIAARSSSTNPIVMGMPAGVVVVKEFNVYDNRLKVLALDGSSQFLSLDSEDANSIWFSKDQSLAVGIAQSSMKLLLYNFSNYTKSTLAILPSVSSGAAAISWDNTRIAWISEAGFKVLNVTSNVTSTVPGTFSNCGAATVTMGTGSAAVMGCVAAMAFDPTGTYVVFFENVQYSLVRYVFATSVYSVVAGGTNAYVYPCVSSILNSVADMIFTADGKQLYISDSGCKAVRRLDMGTLVLSTVATSLSGPDSNGVYSSFVPNFVMNCLAPATTCVSCQPGYFAQAGDNQCTACPVGTYSLQYGASACTACTAPSSLCPCVAGTYQTSTGATVCTSCSAGTYSSAVGLTSCALCAAGFVQSSTGNNTCAACFVGTYQTGVGGSVCTTCPAGLYQGGLAATLCSSCQAGAYSYAGASVCTLCEVGFFQASGGQSKCLPCLSGSYGNTTGKTSCTLCPVGTYVDCMAVVAGFGNQVYTIDLTTGAYQYIAGQSAVTTYSPGIGLQATFGAMWGATVFPGTYDYWLVVTGWPSIIAKVQYHTREVTTWYNTGLNTGCINPVFYSDGSRLACPNSASWIATIWNAVDKSTFSVYVGTGDMYSIAVRGDYQQLAVAGGAKNLYLFNLVARTKNPGVLVLPEPATFEGTVYLPDDSGILVFGNSIFLVNISQKSVDVDPSTLTYTTVATGLYQTRCAKVHPDKKKAVILHNNGLYYLYFGTWNMIRVANTAETIGGFEVSCGPARTTCAACAVGTFANATGTQNCQPCSAGSYQSITGASVCTLCGTGTFQTGVQGSVCGACAAGSYQSTTGTSVCTLCGTGTFQTGVQSTVCGACAAGSFQSALGSSVGSACLGCQAGTYSYAGAGVCTLCEAGFFQASGGQSKCLPCLSGSYGNTTGKTSCTLCPVGTYVDCMAVVAGWGNQLYTVDLTTGAYEYIAGQSGVTTYSPGIGLQATLGGMWGAAVFPGTYDYWLVATRWPTYIAKVQHHTREVSTWVNTGDYNTCTNPVFYSDGSRMACSNMQAGITTIWNTTDKSSFSMNVGIGDLYTAAVRSDYKQLAVAGGIKNLYLFNLVTKTKNTGVLILPEPSYVEAAVYLPDDSGILVFGNSIFLVNISQKSIDVDPSTLTYTTIATGLSQTRCAKVHPDKKKVVFLHNNGLYYLYFDTWKMIRVTNTETGGGFEVSCGPARTTCGACAVGTFANATGTQNCQPCASGSFQSTTGTSVCTLCGTGTFQTGVQSSVCGACAVGLYASSAGGSACTSCAAGSFQSTTGTSVCTLCGTGTFQTGVQGSICGACAAGSYQSALGSSVCTLCGIGTFQTGIQSSVCGSCAAGSYTSSAGGSACIPCATGSYLTATGGSACLVCLTGNFQSSLGKSNCDTCSAGTYQTSQGATICTSCPPGTFNATAGLAVVALCTACSAGTYQPGGGSSCLACPSNSNSSAGASACTPHPGYFDVVGPYAVYRAFRMSGLNTTAKTWTDASITGAVGVTLGSVQTVCDTNGGTNFSVCYASGTTTDGIDFLDAVPSQFTMCAVTRWTTTTAAYQQRVLQGSNDLIHGHYGYNLGKSAGNVYYGSTPGGPKTEDGWTSFVIPMTNWVVLCAQNAFDDVAYINGTSRAVVRKGGVSPTKIFVNTVNSFSNSLSYFGINEVVSWGLYLNNSHVKTINQYMYSKLIQTNVPSSLFVPCTGTSSCSGATSTQCLTTGLFTCCSQGTYWIPSNTSSGCTNCPVGSWGVGSATFCTQCSTGTFATGLGSSTCSACGAGTYNSMTGLTTAVCTLCGTGTFQTGVQSSVCGACAAGSYQNNSGTSYCYACLAGTYQSGVGNTVCVACLIGTYTQNTGGSVCLSCQTGSYQSALGSSVCTLCGTGTFQTGVQSTVCSACAAGSYQSTTGTSACTVCGTGTFQTGVQSSVCGACAAGSYQSTTGTSVCTLCGIGMFQTGVQSSVCSACAAGSYQSALGTSVCTLCGTGTFQTGVQSSVCGSCVAGSFASSVGTSACLACQAGTYSYAGASVCTLCEVGFFQASGGQSKCLPCLSGAYGNTTGLTSCTLCPVGTYVDCMAVVAGFGNQVYTIDLTTGAYQYIAGQSAVTTYSPGIGLQATFGAMWGATVFPGTYDYWLVVTGWPSIIAKIQYHTREVTTWYNTGVNTGCINPVFYSDGSRLACPNSASWVASIWNATDKSIFSVYVGTGDMYSIAVRSDYKQLAVAGGAKNLYLFNLVTRTKNPGVLVLPEPATFEGTVYLPDDSGILVFGNSIFLVNISQKSIDVDPSTLTYTTIATGLNQPRSVKVHPDKKKAVILHNDGLYYLYFDTWKMIRVANTAETIGGLEVSCGPARTTCAVCAIGTFANATGTQNCQPCAAGSYQSTTGTSVCALCGTGTFQSGVQSSVCSSCAVGSYTSLTGGSTCASCAAGSYLSTTGGSACLACQAGTYSYAGASVCTLCEVGFFQASGGQSKCLPCLSGAYGNTTGLTSCILCPVGTYVDCMAVVAGFGNQVYTIDLTTGAYQYIAGQSAVTTYSPGIGLQATLGAMWGATVFPGTYDYWLVVTGWPTVIAKVQYHTREVSTWYSSGVNNECTNPVFYSDGSRFACPNMASWLATIWNATDKSAFSMYVGIGDLYSIAVRSDYKQLAVAGGAKNLYLFNLVTRTKNPGVLVLPEPATFEGTVYLPDDSGILVFGNSIFLVNISQKSIDVDPSTLTYTTIATGLNQPRSVKVHPDKKKAVILHNNGLYYLYFDTWKMIRVANTAETIGGLEVSCGPARTTCAVCAIGTFANATGTQNCQPCAAGSYQSTTGTSVCALCGTGTFQSGVQSSVCSVCAVGSYISSTGGSACLSCASGLYQSGSGFTLCVACGVGTFQSAGAQSSCQNCSVGTFQNASAQTVCAVCPPGTYINTTGASVCASCLPNNWCSGGAVYACPSFTSSPASSLSSSACMCLPGFVGLPCAPCWAGYYCYQNSSTLCPSNSSSSVGSYNVTQCGCLPGYLGPNGTACTPCVSGQYCASGVLNTCPGNMSTPLVSSSIASCTCNAGFYGNYTNGCRECPVGSYCQGGTGAVQCTGNATTASTRTTSSLFCFCAQGFIGVSNNPCSPCPQSSWCWTGVQNQCQLNSNSPAYSSTSLNCTCNAGYTGVGTCTACAAGTYWVSTSACLACASGAYNLIVAQTSCTSCTLGKYTTTPTSGCTNCSVGTYQPSGGATSCLPCSPGSYQSSPAQSSCPQCQAGSYSTGLQGSSCLDCDTGTYLSASGLTRCTVCPDGTYSNKTGSNSLSQCYPCPSNAYCASGGNTTCPWGTQSVPGSSLLTNCTCSLGFSCRFRRRVTVSVAAASATPAQVQYVGTTLMTTLKAGNWTRT